MMPYRGRKKTGYCETCHCYALAMRPDYIFRGVRLRSLAGEVVLCETHAIERLGWTVDRLALETRGYGNHVEPADLVVSLDGHGGELQHAPR